jgi:hypothetical protein
MNKEAFEQDAQVLSTLTNERMTSAEREEEESHPVRLDRKSVRGALSRVIGS